MTSSEISENDHVSRYCKPTYVLESGRISGQAFQLRESEKYLSINWLEYFDGPDKESRIEKIRGNFLDKGFGLSKAGRFAVLNVGKAKDHVFKNSRDQNILTIKRKPALNDPSHGGIFGIDLDIDLDVVLISELLAETVENKVFPGKL